MLTPTTGVAPERSRRRACHTLGELRGEPPNNRPLKCPPASGEASPRRARGRARRARGTADPEAE
eukprot:8705164-Alexandrium_andersonii.AAC.1